MSNLEQIDKNFRIFRKIMKQVNGKSVQIDYAGSGDSGSVEAGRLKLENNEWVDLRTMDQPFIERMSTVENWVPGSGWVQSQALRKVTLSDVADEIVYDMLSAYCGGWEINEGSQGVGYIDVEEGVRLEHTNMVWIPPEDSEDEFEDGTYESGETDVFVYEPQSTAMERLTDQLQED
jgi:hypothetical protein